MNRIDKMIFSLQCFRQSWMIAKVNECREYQEDELFIRIKELLMLEREQQVKENMGAIAYLILFHFQSSLWTASYRYQITVTDESLYLDPQQLSCTWVPRHIYADAQQLKVKVEQELRKHYIRLEAYEIESVTRSILSEYHKFAEVYWSQAVKAIMEDEDFKSLKKRPDWKILSGDYMGDLRLISQLEKGSNE